MKEVFKEIIGYEGLYEVSTKGNVRSLNYKNTGVSHELALNNCGAGYRKVLLCKDGKHTTVRVHRLVATAFIPNPENKPCVNHIDGVRDNNCVENLEWCTKSENELHAYRVLKVKPGGLGKIGKDSHSSVPVDCYSLRGKYLRSFHGMTDAYRHTGVRHGDISAVCRGVRKSAGGFIWKYKKIEEPKQGDLFET